MKNTKPWAVFWGGGQVAEGGVRGKPPSRGRTDPIGPTVWPVGRHRRKDLWEMGWGWADCCLVAESLVKLLAYSDPQVL